MICDPFWHKSILMKKKWNKKNKDIGYIYISEEYSIDNILPNHSYVIWKYVEKSV